MCFFLTDLVFYTQVTVKACVPPFLLVICYWLLVICNLLFVYSYLLRVSKQQLKLLTNNK